jgi:O-antigen/teichoic acid export membrane protein
MITKICGNSDVGLYSFGFSYAILLTLFSNAILQAYQPWLYIKYKLDDLDSIKQSNNLIASAICIVTLGIVAVAPEAIMVLGAKSFWPAKFVVLPIAIGSLFQYVYNTYTGIELYHKKTIIIAIGTIFAAIINYVLNSFFIPIFGYIAAAYATWASYLILAIFHLFAYQKITKKRIYDDKYIWIICTVTCIASFIFMELYEYFFLRYLLLIIILAIIGFTQKTKLIKVYKLVFNKQASEENFSV